MASEKAIENYLREQAKRYGGKAFKWVSPGNAGVPDRLVILPGARIAFAELKAPGKKVDRRQGSVMRFLQRMGFRVDVIDSRDGVDRFLAGMRGGAE